MQTKLKTHKWTQVANTNSWKSLYFLVILGFLVACSDFVTVDLPIDQITSVTIFEDAESAESAVKNIYGTMRNNGMLSRGGLNAYMGLYTDELDAYTNDGLVYQDHNLQAANETLLSWWNSAYNQIYAANSVIEGVGNSSALTSEDRDQFRGEALFVRGYLHLLLVELFGDVPYITTTDYIENTTVSRMPTDLVYQNIITDLEDAIELLPETDISENKIRPNAAAAAAVLARAYLYIQDWANAEAASTMVIDIFGDLEPDLNKVFLKDATGTIWQFAPNSEGDTAEGAIFIFTVWPPFNYSLSENLYDAFETNDLRQTHWIGTVQSTTSTDVWYHAFKYKERFINNTDSAEYSVQLRLAEQYLIRAEARAYQGNIPGAQADLNRIRNRAGLGNTPANTLETLLDKILDERRVELFTEKGHRWFDLKRMGRAAEVLAPIKSGWRDTDILLPIPEVELSLNPNLLPQNDGY